MKRKQLKWQILAGMFILSLCGNGQTLIQKVNETNYGPADTLGAFPIFKNSDTNIVFAGNDRVNAQQCDFKTLCVASGTTSWSQSFNANLKKAYTTATKHVTGFIYVVGCTYIDSIHGQDLTVLKYTNAGTLVWTYYYNGSASQDDIATDVTVDPSGNVYVTGATGGILPNLSDYVTIKLNSSGVNQWTKIYDYTSLLDIPMGIKYLPGVGQVVVSGTSGSGFNSYDFATVTYNVSTGVQASVVRQTSTTAGLNKGINMTTDSSDNIYFTGMVWNGSNFDFQITKFDSSLNLLWSQTFDGHGYDDSGYGIAIDNSGNVIATGFSNTNALGTSKELVVLKYNSSGTQQWVVKHQPSKNNSTAEGIKIKINATNDIYIGGNQAVASGNQDAFILKLNSSGKDKFYKTWNSTFNSKDIFYDIMLDDSYIYITALSHAGSGIYNKMVVQFEERNVKPIFINPTTTPFAGNHLILKFNPAIMKMTNINNKEFLFGKLSDFIPDSITTKINTKLTSERYTCHSENFKASKIFLQMTAKDSLSTTRLGDVIKVPKFYSAILVEIPTITPLTLPQVSDKLNTIKPSLYYSELDFGVKLMGTPNDNYFYQQSSFAPTTYYTDAHINVDSSWSIANGQPYVKVGIFDSGIRSTHYDLTDYNFNVNIGGYDFADNIPYIGNDTYSGGHGTQVTGIIAAARNNLIGTAGIAGRNDSLNTQGVSIYDCKIVTSDSQGYDSLASFQTIAQAMYHSVRGDSTGFALNVLNNSFSFNYNQNNTYADTLFKSKTLQDQIVFASRNGVAVTGSKGYFGTAYALPDYPADWNPEIVSSVGGSGQNAHSCQQANYNCFANGSSTVQGLNTNWGVNIDFVAPAAPLTIQTPWSQTNNVWGPFGGCSASAAHVSGTYGLMMSYFNHTGPHWDNLLHEDCENILKRTCTDITSTVVAMGEGPGYDRRTGFGRINVNAAIKAINNQHYRFRHIAKNHATISTSNTLLYSSVPVKWPAFNNLAAGVYSTNVYKVTTTLTYTLNSTETIIDKWPMYKECFGWSPDTASKFISIDRPYYSKIISANNTTAVLETYVFQNLSNSNYYPNALADARSAITLYTYDTAPTLAGIKNNQGANRNFILRPNPSEGAFYITFGSEISTNLEYTVFDMLGKQIIKGNYNSQYGENNIPINIQNYASGLYIVNVSDGSEIIYRQKVVKH